MSEKQYSEKDIQILTAVEAVRKRPAMYLGSQTASALNNLLLEIASFLAETLKRTSEINIFLEDDNAIRITTDDPAHLDICKAGSLSEKLAFLATGRLPQNITHSFLGISAATALSSKLIIRGNDGVTGCRLEFHDSELKDCCAVEPTGTVLEIYFIVDPSIISGKYNYEQVIVSLQELAVFYPKARLSITDKRSFSIYAGKLYPGRVFHFPNGLRDYVAHLNTGRQEFFRAIPREDYDRMDEQGQRWYSHCVTEPVLEFKATDEQSGITIELAFTYSYSSEPLFISFGNRHRSYLGGSHVDSFKEHFVSAMSSLIKEQERKELAEEENEEREESEWHQDKILRGITCVIAVDSIDNIWGGSTKEKVESEDAAKLTRKIVDEVKRCFENGTTEAKQMLSRLYFRVLHG